MTRDDFLTAVREFADQLGSELWAAIARQTEAAKAVALQAAVGQLRAQIAGDTPDQDAPVRRRAPRRCSKCDELGHDARKCPRAAGNGGPTGESPVAADHPRADGAEPDADEQTIATLDADDDQDDEDEDQDENDDPREAPSPPPTRVDRFARIEASAARRRGEA